MTMTKYFTCCETCYYDLRELNSNAAGLWMVLCNNWLVERKAFHTPNSKYIVEIRDMEIRGFLISTDIGSAKLAIKIKEPIIDANGEPFFCSKKDCQHV